MRVLIVEDSDSIAKMIEALVSARGFEVKTAGNGAKGLEEAYALTPDIVLLDINLPGGYDGLEVCRKLRAQEATAIVPIIIISAMVDDEVKQKAIDAGATAYFQKPFSPLALLKEIESLTKRQSSGRFPTAPKS